MKIARLTKEQKDFFLDMDPLMMLERLEFPGSFALVAIEQNKRTQRDIPAGLMICSQWKDRLVIEWLYIAIQYRTQGIGEQLLLAAFQTAKQQNLPMLCAYINKDYGRELICPDEELFFKERLFQQEQQLPGEWFTDLRTLSMQPFFKRKATSLPQVVSLRKLSATMVRDAIAALANAKGADMLYSVAGNSELFDSDLSFLIMDGNTVRAALLVQSVTRNLPEERNGVIVRVSEDILYPALFYAKSEPDVTALLFASLQAANEKYTPDTNVQVILTSSTYSRLLTAILPTDQIENKLLIANVDDFEQIDLRLELQLRQLAQLG